MIDSFAPQINEIIDDRYKILAVVGSGGMAYVYKAHDLITDKDVAIKMLRPERAGNKVNLYRFEREARAAASLNHQNIVKVINVGTFKGFPYMVNELITGQTLAQVLEVRGKFSFLEACDTMYQLCSAVMYAHSHGVIHRDIKPDNVFLTQDGTIKLGDFGIATFQNSGHVTATGNFLGTIKYAPPELVTKNQGGPSERSDIYSIGITFFELITGRVPFDAEQDYEISRMIAEQKFPNIKRFNPRTPDCISKIIYRCCEKDPVERYPDCEYLRKDIEKILKNPSLLEESHSFFSFFRKKDPHQKEQLKAEKEHKKALKMAAKAAKREKR